MLSNKLKTGFGFKNLQTKLVACFLFIGLLPLVVMGWLAFRQSKAELLDSAGTFLESAAATAIDTFNQEILVRYQEARTLAFNPMARGTANEVVAAANYYVMDLEVYDLIVVADLDGKIVAANTVT